jgi:hypothetical protein
MKAVAARSGLITKLSACRRRSHSLPMALGSLADLAEVFRRLERLLSTTAIKIRSLVNIQVNKSCMFH